MVVTTKKSGSGFVGPSGTARRRITASPVITLAAVLMLTGCSSVPDALNPVEWYEGTTDTVGGWFSDDEPQSDGTQTTASSTADKPFPNLASVPERPTPSTTEEERAAIQQGLVADRDSARYTDSADASAPAAPPKPRAGSGQQTASLPAAPPPRASISAPDSSAASSQAAVTKDSPPPPAPTVATPPPATEASAPAASSAPPASPPARSSGESSGLWPHRPAPTRESITPVTTGKVTDTHSMVKENPDAPTRALASEPRMPATASGAAAAASRSTAPAPSATGRSLDSAGNQATARATPAPSASGDEGPEITRKLISTRTVKRTADGEVHSETVTRADGTTAPVATSGAAPNAPSPSVAAPSTNPRPMPEQQAAAPAASPAVPSMPAPDSAVDQSPSVIVDGATLDQYQMGFSGPAYLVGTVNFGHGSAALSADDLDMIRSIASAAQETDAYIRVIGHASARTAEMELANHELVNFQESLARAERVGDALVRAGVPRQRVLVEAMSASQPLFYESMPSGEAGNRRAEILFQY